MREDASAGGRERETRERGVKHLQGEHETRRVELGLRLGHGAKIAEQVEELAAEARGHHELQLAIEEQDDFIAGTGDANDGVPPKHPTVILDILIPAAARARAAAVLHDAGAWAEALATCAAHRLGVGSGRERPRASACAGVLRRACAVFHFA